MVIFYSLPGSLKAIRFAKSGTLRSRLLFILCLLNAGSAESSDGAFSGVGGSIDSGF